MEQKNPYSHQEQERRRIKQGAYAINGLKKLFHSPPISVLFAAIMCIIPLLLWELADAITPFIPSISLLVPVINWSARFLFEALFILALLGVLYLLGTPHKAKEAEIALARAFQIKPDVFFSTPLLIHTKQIKGTKVEEFIFWSRWIPLEKWNEAGVKTAILSPLGYYSTDAFVCGKQKYTVCIKAILGTVPKDRQTPQDPLFGSGENRQITSGENNQFWVGRKSPQ